MTRRMRLGSVLWGLMILTTAWAAGPITPRFSTVQITSEQWTAYLSEVKAMPDVRCESFQAAQLMCDSSTQHTIWIFTRWGHPAHPAVSRGVMVLGQAGQGVTIGIDRSGHYAGNRAAFYAWMDQFAPLDQSQIKQWQSMLQSK